MTVRGEIVQSLRETGARSREAGFAPPGSSEGGVPPSWGFYKGAGPLVRVGEAGSRAEPACLDAWPTASRCVATALARSSALCMIMARKENTALGSNFRLRDCNRSARE